MKCPGQDSRYWEGDAVFEVDCTNCGRPVEFFKDESNRVCRACGHRMPNPRLDFGCAAYCPYAEQCVGSLPAASKDKQELLKEKVALEMKRTFGNDFKRIGHATRVARYAEEINRVEQGNPAVVLVAAYLHDIGLKEAERKYQSTEARYQHQEGPPLALKILTKLEAEETLIEEVCDIIGHHHAPRAKETVNFKVLYDADLLVNLEEKQEKAPMAGEQLAKVVARSFLTETGRKIATERLLTATKNDDHRA